MKFSLFLLTVVSLQLSATVFSQQMKLSTDIKGETIREALKIIEEESSIRFFYNDDYKQLNSVVLQNITEGTLDELLVGICRDTDLSYKLISDNFIVVFPKTMMQGNKVTGTVTDAGTGEPLPGVYVRIEGTQTGAVTDVDGNYTVDVPDVNSVLVFSFVGYNTENITVAGKTNINVSMIADIKALEEIVVIGYGTMKKSDLTGSISGVSSNDFKLQPMMQSTDALTARLSGVEVVTTSGNPDASIKIRIRGANSINGGNDPLYVCDGVVDAEMPTAEDIESIEVLKDASATAIYGSRGANGVILITTKKGTSGKTNISFDMFSSFQKPVNLYEKLNAYEYAQEVNILQNNYYTDNQLEDFKNNGGTDWQKEVLQSSWNQNYHLAINGGNNNMKFHISAQYKKLNGLIKRTNSENYGIRSNFEINLYKKLKLEWFISGGHTHYRNTGSNLNLGGTNAILFNAMTWGPTEDIYESDGSYNLADQFGAMGNNPVMIVNEMDRWKNNYNVNSNSALTWEIMPGMTVQYRLNMNYGFNNSYDWQSSIYTSSNALASGVKSLDKSIFQNIIVNWNKSFGQHNLALTAVGEGNKYIYDALTATGSYFGNENLEYWGMSTGTTQTSLTGWSDNSILSFVGRANYNYANKYYLTGAMRTDGSSKFADGNKWGYFPSGSVAWRVSEEEFIKNLNIFSDLKIRASYGKTGNQGVNPYSTIASLQRLGAYYTYTSRVYGYTSKTINKNLQWEETGQVDFGIDAGFFRNRLNFTMDYYKKNTKKLLLTVTTPYYLGGYDIYQNKGEVNNKGFEFSVNAIPVQTQNFTWDVRANFSTNKNEIVDVGGETIYGLSSSGNNDALLSDETYIIQEGIELGTLYGYKWLGIWQEDEAAEAAVYGNKPGDNKYADLEPDGTIDASDRTAIGNGNPNYIWGINSTMRYKNWDFNIVVQGVHGSDKLNVMYAMAASQHSKSRTITLKEAWENSWTAENKSNLFPSVTSTTSTNYINSTQWLQDASFVRLKNISLGYTFNRQLTKIAECHVYVSAQNLFTLTDYKGYDPETTSTIESDVCTGIDTGITPTARTVTFGLQLSF